MTLIGLYVLSGLLACGIIQIGSNNNYLQGAYMNQQYTAYRAANPIAASGIELHADVETIIGDYDWARAHGLQWCVGIEDESIAASNDLPALKAWVESQGYAESNLDMVNLIGSHIIGDQFDPARDDPGTTWYVSRDAAGVYTWVEEPL